MIAEFAPSSRGEHHSREHACCDQSLNGNGKKCKWNMRGELVELAKCPIRNRAPVTEWTGSWFPWHPPSKPTRSIGPTAIGIGQNQGIQLHHPQWTHLELHHYCRPVVGHSHLQAPQSSLVHCRHHHQCPHNGRDMRRLYPWTFIKWGNKRAITLRRQGSCPVTNWSIIFETVKFEYVSVSLDASRTSVKIALSPIFLIGVIYCNTSGSGSANWWDGAGIASVGVWCMWGNVGQWMVMPNGNWW